MALRTSGPGMGPTLAVTIAALLFTGLAAPATAREVAAAPASLRASGGFFTAATAETLSYRRAGQAWTPERIAAAEPLELAFDGSLRTAPRDPELFAAAPEPFSSRQVNPANYPNRVHGKLLGTFAGLGDFSCSATVVSSGSGSLLTTAGHCAYDVKHRIVASNLTFIPGFSAGSIPYGAWPVSNLILNEQWVKRGSLDYDLSMMRTTVSPFGPVERIVGSRGIGFNQPRKQRLQAYGYPARGKPSYDGNRLIRCGSGYVGDPQRYGGPRGRGMHCDQQQGSSGGGWVAQHSFVVSNTSHGYPRLSNRLFFGPYYGSVAKSMYRARIRGWPSVGPVRCGGRVASIIGSNRGERIRGTHGNDVIATLDGRDRISGKGGRDRICAGAGDDRVSGGGGKDRIDGGSGRDRCGRRKDGNELHACEGGGRKR